VTLSDQELITQFVMLFVVLDPAATIALFLITAKGLSPAQARRVAIIAAATAFVVLVFFIVFFQLLLEAMHVPLSSFQLAGSIVLLVYGLHLVFDRIKADDSFDIDTTEGLFARSVYPLAIPGLAGPGSMMTVTLLTENYSRTMLQQLQTVGIVAICLAIVVLIYFAAQPINKVLGKGGLSLISRVMGLILSSIAVTNGIVSIKLVFGLA
jgi:multiple antibiotic resistance protein